MMEFSLKLTGKKRSRLPTDKVIFMYASFLLFKYNNEFATSRAFPADSENISNYVLQRRPLQPPFYKI